MTRIGRTLQVLLLLVLAPLPVLWNGAGAARGAMPTATGQDVVVLRAATGARAALLSRPATGDRGGHYLPMGLIAPGGGVLYAAQPGSDSTSRVSAFDVATGHVLRSLKLTGVFSTRAGDYAAGEFPLPPPAASTAGQRIGMPLLGRAVDSPIVAGRVAIPARAGFPADGSWVLSTLSFNGRWLALREVSIDFSVPTTRIVVIDTDAMRVVADHQIDGQFGLDAISADGRLLYLIESLQNQSYYQVRSFQVDRGVLDAKVVVAPGEKPGTMSGEAWTRAWSPDGSWLYTLYVQGIGHAFVHALHLSARATVCLDLPWVGQAVGDISHFTLSVAPSGKMLYAVNPVLGKAVAIHLPAGRMRMVDLGRHAGSPQRTQDGAAIAPDGKTVFVATNHGLWAVDTRTLAVRTSYLADQGISGLAGSNDGRRLYVLEAGRGLVVALDSSSGRTLGSMAAGPATWSIEGVLNRA